MLKISRRKLIKFITAFIIFPVFTSTKKIFFLKDKKITWVLSNEDLN